MSSANYKNSNLRTFYNLLRTKLFGVRSLRELIKTHLICIKHDKRLLEEINKYCHITGRNVSLQEGVLWAQKGGGEDPELFIINCGPYFLSATRKTQAAIRNKLVANLKVIKKNRPYSRIVLLLPADKEKDHQLITKLIKVQIYNFWFFDSFDEKDIEDFILQEKTQEDAENYLMKLNTKSEIAGLKRSSRIKESIFGRRGFNKLYKPYYIKSNIVAFWSEDDTLVNQALAVLTALTLAEQGFKTLLIETVSPLPHLATLLSIRHPYFNISHGLSMYTQGNNGFIRQCFFNTSKYVANHYSDVQETLNYPENLYFLPDMKRNDNVSEAAMLENWSEFIAELGKVIIFEKGFSFIIFICCGRNTYNEQVWREIAYTKFITTNLLPCSLAYGLEEKETEDNVHLIAAGYMEKIGREIKELNKRTFLFPPDCLEKDFLNYVYFKKKKFISEDTQLFINAIIEKLDVKIGESMNKSFWEDRIKKLRI